MKARALTTLPDGFVEVAGGKYMGQPVSLPIDPGPFPLAAALGFMLEWRATKRRSYGLGTTPGRPRIPDWALMTEKADADSI